MAIEAWRYELVWWRSDSCEGKQRQGLNAGTGPADFMGAQGSNKGACSG